MSAAANGISKATTATADSCGYAGTSTSTTAPLNTVVFNESGVAKAINLGGNPANPTVNYYYSDEHALTLGATSNGGVVSPFSPAAYGTATNPYSDFGQKSDGTPIAGRSPLRVGDPTAKDPLHRPIYPAAFVTDVTGLSPSAASYKAGDWQNLNTPSSGANGAQSPEFVAGTWKPFQGASTSTGDPGSGNPLTVGTTNGLGPNADKYPGLNISGATSLEKYTAEIRWHASGLQAFDPNTNTFEPKLLPGHTYRVQVIVHDGDQNKTGGDTGEACAVISLPGISTTATGGQIQTDGTATVSDTATVTGVSTPLPSGTSQVEFKVYGPDATPGTDNTDDCSGTPQTRNVALNSTTPNGAYPSGNFTVNAPGDYHFTADLSVGGTIVASSVCDATNETATVGSRPTSLTTEAGGPYAPPASLSDTATLSGGTTNAGGTLTFTLYADNGSGGCTTPSLGSTQVSVNHGANGAQYTGTINAPANPGYFVPGTYHWSVSYGGDPSTGNESASDGIPCPATDTSTNHENPVVLSPHIAVSKTPDSQTIESGTTAGFTITVTNDGTVALTNVNVTDPNSPDCVRTATQTAPLIAAAGNLDSSFDPGEQFSYTCSSPTLTANLHNVATAHGTGGSKVVEASDSADVTVIHPSIDVLKNPPTQSVPLGGTANFTITVTNNGDIGLTNVTVTDAQAADCALTAAQTLPKIQAVGNHDSTFDPNESFTYNCSLTNVQTAFINVAQACGDDALSTHVCDTSDNGGNPPPGCPEASRCAGVGIDGLTTDQDFVPRDNAHVSVTPPAGGTAAPPNGQVTFDLYKGDATCTVAADRIVDDTVDIPASNTSNPVDVHEIAAKLLSQLNADKSLGGTGGTYYWQVSYSGDTNGNASFTGTCGEERFTVTNS